MFFDFLVDLEMILYRLKMHSAMLGNDLEGKYVS
jgi:hypothetical protein